MNKTNLQRLIHRLENTRVFDSSKCFCCIAAYANDSGAARPSSPRDLKEYLDITDREADDLYYSLWHDLDWPDQETVIDHLRSML